MDFKTGGQQVILRLVEAYGFTTRQMLCDHLGVSKSTLATRFMRDIFPAEWVIQCALETNVSLRWLTLGTEPMFDNVSADIESIPKKKILDGQLFDAGYLLLDKTLTNRSIESANGIVEGEVVYVTDLKNDEVSDGKWLVAIDGKISIRKITLLPKSRVKVDNKNASFECPINDMDFIGKVILTINNVN